MSTLIRSASPISSPPQQQQFCACAVSLRPSDENRTTTLPLTVNPSSCAVCASCVVCTFVMVYTVWKMACVNGIGCIFCLGKMVFISLRNDRVHSGSEHPDDASKKPPCVT